MVPGLQGFSLIDRPPLTEGWHLVLMIVAGGIVAGLMLRWLKRRVARLQRDARRAKSSPQR